MRPLAVHHVSLNVDELESALHFYTRVLGLQLRTDRPDLEISGAWLDAGGQQVHLIVATPPPGLGQHFALLVDDLDVTVAELRARGVEVSDPRPLGSSRQSFVADPCGNVIEIHEAGVRP
jgi:catechol 2,3-dioxygenase-like lactoylglutathione lyase family enzyme